MYPLSREELKGTSGLQRSFGSFIFYKSYFERETLKKDRSLYKYFKYNESTNYISINILDKVMSLLENPVTNELYGFDYNTLMSMDFSTFEEIDERIERISKAKNKAIDKLIPKNNQLEHEHLK